MIVIILVTMIMTLGTVIMTLVTMIMALVTMIMTLVTMIMTLVTMIMTDSAVQSSDILVSDLPNQRVPCACFGPVPSQGRKDDHPHHFDRHHQRDHDDHHSNDICTNPLLPFMLKLKFWMLSI